MVRVWRDEDIRDGATQWDLDGKGTPLRPDDILYLKTKSVYIENLIEFKDADLASIFISSDIPLYDIIPLKNDAGLADILWKYSAGAGPPPPEITGARWDSVAMGKSLAEAHILVISPPPVPDFPVNGEPVYVGDGDVNAKAAELGWQWWAAKDGWLFPQDDADRYWVAGAGDWSDNTNHWSASSGGGGGASKPGDSDAVIVDNGSDVSGAAFNITVNEGASCASYSCNCTDATATLGVGTQQWISKGAYTQTNGGMTVGAAGVVTVQGTLTITAGTFGSNTNYTLDLDGTLASSAGTLSAPNASGSFTFAGATWNTPTTYTSNSGTVTFNIAGTTTLGNNSIQFNSVTVNNGATLAISTYNITVGGNLVIGSGTSGAVTTSTGTKTINGTTTINSGGSFGTATTTYTLDMNGNLLTSAGTLIAPQAAGSFTFSGATWNSPTTFTHSSGTVTFDLAGTTTLGNASIQFNKVAINNGVTLNTSAVSDFALTTAQQVSLTGTLACNNSTVSIGSGWISTAFSLLINPGGIFTGGGGTHTIGSLGVGDGVGSTVTLTSGTTTFDAQYSAGFPFVWQTRDDTTLNHSSGTVTFTYAGTQQLADAQNTARTFSTFIVNNASCVLSYYSSQAFNLTCTTLTVTAGSFSTWDGSTGFTLTVSGTTSVTGTLNLRGTIAIVETLATVTVNNGGTLSCGTTTSNISGNVTVGGGASGAMSTLVSVIHIDGTTTINAGATLGTASQAYTLNMDGNLLTSAGTLIAPASTTLFTFSGATWNTPSTFTNSSGGVTFDLAGTTSLGNNSTQFNAITVNNGTTLTCTATPYNLTCAGDVVATGTLNGTSAAVSLKDLTISVTTGVYTATSGTTTITGKDASSDAWVNNNTFTHSNGKVDFTGTGASYHIHGNNTWYTFEISVAAASTYLFMNGQTQTIANSTTMTGTAGNILTLNSVSGAATWLYTIQAGKTQSHSYLNVTYSNAGGGDTAVTSNSTNGGNNTNWSFQAIWIADALANWSTGAAWGSGAKPAAGEAAVFNSAHNGNCTVDEASANLSSFTVTAYTGTIIVNNTINVTGTGGVSVSFGTGGAYSGAAGFNLTETMTFSSGGTVPLVTVNGSGKTVTLGAALTTPTLTITAGAVDTSAASNYALTTTTACNVTGTLTCNNSTCSFTGTGSTGGYSLYVSGTFTGGSGTHTMGSVRQESGGTSLTFTSGTTTINNVKDGATICWAIGGTWDDGNGTIAFTYAGAQTLYSDGNTARILYNLTVNNASCALSYFSGASFALTVANNLTVTAGSFTTWDGTTSASLTVSGTCALTGTLSTKAGTVSIGSGKTDDWAFTIGASGVFDGGTGTNHTFGSFAFNGNSASATFTSGTTTINGKAATAQCFGFRNTCTFSHGSGTVAFTYAGAQGLYRNTVATESFYNLTVNNASNALSWLSGSAIFPLTVANNLTITAGSFTTWDGTTSADLTVTNATSITGTLDCKASTVSLGSGVVGGSIIVIIGTGGTLTSGSGTHTYGSIYAQTATSTLTLSSGTTTINGADANGNSLAFGNASATLNHSNGTVTFTRAGAQKLYDVANTPRSLYNFTINNASCAITYYTGASFALTCANNLSITAGSFTTWDGTVSANLTVTAATTGGGTLDTKASTVSLGSGKTDAYAVNFTGTLDFDSSTVTIGSIQFSGPIILSSGTITVDSNFTAGGFAWRNVSGANPTVSTGTVAFTGAVTTEMRPGSTGSEFYNLTLNNASFVGNIDTTALQVGNNLTITSGQLTTNDGGTSRNLTVTATTSITGTLACNASTVSLGSGITASYGVSVETGGTLTGGSGAHTYGSIRGNNTCTITLTSNTTTINSENTGIDVVMSMGSGITFSSGNGTVLVTGAVTSRLDVGNLGATGLYNLTLNNASLDLTNTGNTTVSGALTITAGTYNASTLILTVTGTTSITGTLTPNTSTSTFNGAVTVNSGGVLGGATNYVGDFNAAITISNGGTLSASTGTITIVGDFTDSNNYTTNPTNGFLHNSGTLNQDGGSYKYITSSNGTVFNNYTLSSAAVGGFVYCIDVTIRGTLTVGAGSYCIWAYNGPSGTYTLTLGTSSAAGTIANSGNFATYRAGGSAGGNIVIQAASSSYPCVCTGTDWDWDGSIIGGNATTVNIKWLDYQINATTGGGGVTINFTGNMTIDSWTTSLNDTLTLSNTITASGDVVAAGIITGNAAAFSAGSMSITGTYTATSGTTTITSKNGSSDAWNNSGTFTNSSGKVDFTGQSGTYHIHGNNSWYQLEISVTAACTYLFMNGQTQTIAAAGSVTMSGASGQLLTFNSVSGAADWSYILSPGAGQSHSYLDVAHSDASGGDAVQAFNGTNTNSGNNTNWIFTAITSTVMNEDYDWW